MIGGVNPPPGDPWQKLAAIRAQAAMVRNHATELEQLGLTLSGRDLSTVDHADLVSYLVWIALLTSQTAQVMANWGVGLVAYMETTMLAAGIPHTDPAATQIVPAAECVEPPVRSRRRWRRS